MLDLKGEYRLFADQVQAAVHAVLDSASYINGPQVAEFETALARRCGVTHALAVSSGTDALLCSLMTLGIGPGDEVIVPAFTFFATAGVVHRLGATPVFADIDKGTFNLDPASVERALTPRTRAITAVHMFGQCADMDAINAVARGRGIPVIEDAAQAIGAEYRGRPACSLADIACLSFYPTKNLGGFGEGGMILTSDDELGRVARQLRNHGETTRYHHERVGGNFRLDTLKAAVLLVKLARLDEFTRSRQRNAERYNERFADSPVVTPCVAGHRTHVYHQYTVRVPRRDDLVEFLRGRGVGTGVYYPVPLHLQQCFSALGYSRGDLPVTEAACEQVVSLPCHPLLATEDVDHVADGVLDFLKTEGGRRPAETMTTGAGSSQA